MQKLKDIWSKFVQSIRLRPWLYIGIAAAIVLGISGYYAGYYGAKKPVVQDQPAAKVPEKPTTKPSPLTGVEVAIELADRPVTAVVIENSPEARPQSGLGQAGVVYEALAEGGITRTLAFFQEQRPEQLGPIRSVRPYFVDWTLEFDAAIAHVGGNHTALGMIRNLGVKDMNEFGYGSYFYRARDRYAPHNSYTTSDKLDALQKAAGFFKPSTTFKPSPRVKDAPEATPSKPTINVTYSYPLFGVQYQYDATCNCYNRFLAGAPHIDRNSGKQIQVKNIVVEYMATSYGKTAIGEQTTLMGTPGSGQALVFKNGGVTTGTWNKTAHTARTSLTDTAGAEIPLNVGNTWYSIVPDTLTVGY